MRRLAVVMVILSIQTGCTYVQSHQKLNLAPFAENTISLAAEIEYGITESSRLVNLRELWDDPAIARVADNIFDEVGTSLDDTGRALLKRIDEINRNARYYEKLVNEVQYSVFQRFVYLGTYRISHDQAQLDSLFMEDPQLLEHVTDPKNVTQRELMDIEERLFQKTEAMQVFADQIKPDIEKYHLQQIELAELYKQASHQLRRARTTMIVWSRAHRNLAHGITDPAKVDLFDITKKALKTAL